MIGILIKLLINHVERGWFANNAYKIFRVKSCGCFAALHLIGKISKSDFYAFYKGTTQRGCGKGLMIFSLYRILESNKRRHLFYFIPKKDTQAARAYLFISVYLKHF